jgi:hypothetical protein
MGEEITCNKLNILAAIELAERLLKTGKVTAGSNETTEFANPYSRKVSTTFVPMKPLDPVTRMRSLAKAL